ncbi:Methyl-accepting chemotaxis protein (MCP) signaling domain protein [compost metagenome]
MLNRLSVKLRLLLLSLIPLLALVGLTLISLGQMHRLDKGIQSLYADRVVPMQQIRVVTASYSALLFSIGQKYRADQIEKEGYRKETQAALEQAERQWQAFLGTHLLADEVPLVQTVEHALPPARQLVEKRLQQLDNMSLWELDDLEFNRQSYAAFTPLEQALDELYDYQMRVAAEFREQASARHDFMQRLYAVGCGLLVAALALLALLIYRSIQRPLEQMRDVIGNIAAEADLRLRITVSGSDELADTAGAFNRMMDRFQALVGELGHAVAQMAAAAGKMQEISCQVSQAATVQEEQSGQVVAAINQMSAAIQEVAGSALNTSRQAQDADARAADGTRTLLDNVQAIQRLAQRVNSATEVIQQLSTQSERIGHVLTTIRGVAEQTNLLALNAAIEAARAGEAGRGFAVVADEVRSLAGNTQQATESIRQMIEQLQQSAQLAVQAMGEASHQATASAGQAHDSGGILESIKQAVARIAAMNEQISAATEQQTAVANEINANVARFQGSIVEVGEGSRQSSTASAELAELSVKLQRQVAQFSI